MKLLPLFRVSLAELFGLMTFAAFACVALLNASDITAWIVGGLFWLGLVIAIAGAAVPAWPGRAFCAAFLGAALLHLVLMQYTGANGQSHYDVDMPTFYLIEALWEAIPAEHWLTGHPVVVQDGEDYIVQGGRILTGMPYRIDPTAAAHANFRGIATQLFSVMYGVLAGFIALGIARANQKPGS
jgi:hypothetical protein